MDPPGDHRRPTCPSRRARAENIRFHDTLAEVRATGRLMEMDGGLSSWRLAQVLGFSPSHLHRLFRRMTGTTPAAWNRAFRRARPKVGRAPRRGGRREERPAP